MVSYTSPHICAELSCENEFTFGLDAFDGCCSEVCMWHRRAVNMSRWAIIYREALREEVITNKDSYNKNMDVDSIVSDCADAAMVSEDIYPEDWWDEWREK